MSPYGERAVYEPELGMTFMTNGRSYQSFEELPPAHCSTSGPGVKPRRDASSHAHRRTSEMTCIACICWLHFHLAIKS